MASRQRQRVQTGRTGGSRSGQARAPPSAHLKRATSTAKSILNSRGRSNNQGPSPGVKRPVGRMKPIDFSDLERQDNGFRVPTPVSLQHRQASAIHQHHHPQALRTTHSHMHRETNTQSTKLHTVDCVSANTRGSSMDPCVPPALFIWLTWSLAPQ